MLAIESLPIGWKNIKHKTVKHRYDNITRLSLRKWYRTERVSNPWRRDIDDEIS